MRKGPEVDPVYSEKHERRLLLLWEKALASPLGISVSTPRVASLQRELYGLRRKLRESGDKRFDSLRVTLPSDSDQAQVELWILPSEVELQERLNAQQGKVEEGDDSPR